MLRAFCLVAALVGTATVVAAEEAGTPPAFDYSGGSYVLEVTAEARPPPRSPARARAHTCRST